MTTPRDRIEKFVAYCERIGESEVGTPHMAVEIADLRALLDATKPKPRRPSPERARVLLLVPDNGETISPFEVAQALGITTNNASQHLFRLVEAGQARRVSMGKYTRAP